MKENKTPQKTDLGFLDQLAEKIDCGPKQKGPRAWKTGSTKFRKRRRNWKFVTNQELLDIARNYKTRTAFVKGEPMAYRYSKLRGEDFFQKICGHMKLIKRGPKLKLYSEKEIIGVASQCKSKAEFKALFPSAKIQAMSKGADFYKATCAHMKTPHKYTQDNLVKIAKKYSSRFEFFKNEGGAYEAAKQRFGKPFFEKICSHMVNPNAPKPFPDGEILAKAKKCQTITEFKKKYRQEHRTAVSKGEAFYAKIKSHMRRHDQPRKWTDGAIRESASRYKSVSRWKKENEGAYDAAWTRGILGEVTSHMIRLVKGVPRIWTNEALIKSARKYSSVKEWRTRESSAYHAAWERGVLDDVTANMNKIKKRNAA